MKLSFPLLLLLSALAGPNAAGQKKHQKPSAFFKVVGYYFINPAFRDTVFSDSSYPFLDKITHLNIAFINPDENGNFREDLPIDTLISRAHANKVRVLASIAGGGTHPYYKQLLQDGNRKSFITNLMKMVHRYHLDGIDVDLEGSDIGNNYEPFISELAGCLGKEGKLITAAIATAYKDELPDKALRRFDFVNIMSYDQTGPWDLTNPGNHSPYSMAVDDLNYWNRVRAIPKTKMVLGLPFYGYGFGKPGTPAISMNYQQIDASFPLRGSSDTLSIPGDILMYYNNQETIEKKTRLALKKAGGVMIWQLLGDTRGNRSLLNTINEEIHEKASADRP